ncbi:MAG: TonB-dependent receptor [Prevotella sp.]|nr:TonB-dependent receptor [Prevotella sp.]
MKKVLLLFVSLFLSTALMAQTKDISGVVKDDAGEAVIGASVVIEGTQNAAATDVNGHFALKGVQTGSTLVVSYIGFQTYSTTVGGGSFYDITLSEDDTTIDEVVVTGYGGQQKRGTLTTAISKMDNKVLKTAAYSNVGQALQGTVSGLRVVNNSGQPGSQPSIVLRGGATITGSNNAALIIVDGIVRPNLGEINPNDIESIQILKDAASTAIYGARANGGVILIETKSGKQGHSSVNYKFKIGTNKIRKGYEYVDAHDFIYYNRLGWKRYAEAANVAINADNQQGYGTRNDLYDCRYYGDDTKDLVNQGWQVMVDPIDPSRQLIYYDHSGALDDAVFDDDAMTQEHYLSFDGGNDRGAYSSTFGYYKEDGIMRGTSLKRFTGTINGHYKVLPFLRIKGGATYSWNTTPSLYTNAFNILYRTRSMRPTWNPWLDDGSPAPGVSSSDGNPIYWQSVFNIKNSTRRASYNAGLDLDIIPKHLVFSFNTSLYHYDYQYESFNKAYTQQNWGGAYNTVRQAYAEMSRYTQIQVNGQLTYTNTFADAHNLEAMVGWEYYNRNDFDFDATTEQSPTDDVPTLNAGSDYTDASTTWTGYRIKSWFGRVNYNYKMRYLLSLVARYDGISRLKDNRWGFFPGVSFGWNLSEEDFFKNSNLASWVSNVKPRVSYGVNGNVNGLGNYTVYGSYSSAGKYNGDAAIYNSGLLNTNLKWEQSKSFEVGLDLGFLNNRLALILDYYNRETKDLLTSMALPGYTGFSSITTNLGNLRNQGIEVEVRANIINQRNNGLKWDVTANLSTVSNKILKLPYNGVDKNRVGGYEVANGTNGTRWIAGRQEGGKLGEMVAYKQHHIFKDWDDVKQWANTRIDNVANLYGPGLADQYAGKSGWKPIQPGDVCWVDYNGDDVIDALDQDVVGNMFPNVMGGFSSTLSYKGLSLYARFDYQLGHTLYNDAKARVLGQYQGAFNVIKEVKDMWSEENPNASLPAFYYADQLAKKNITRSVNGGYSADNQSSAFYEKGDYLALRELTLSYELPKDLIKKAHLTGATVSLTGQNLFYITGYSGVSPEPALYYYEGIDWGRYPTPKTWLFGVSLTF